MIPDFFQVFAKNSLMENIFEEEKMFDSRAPFFLENSSLLGVFWPRRGLQVNPESDMFTVESYNYCNIQFYSIVQNKCK